MEFWASRCYPAFMSVHATAPNSESLVSIDTVDRDEDIRGSFQCPFCYVDIEVSLLCSHLQDEHCFDVKNSVCPLCAASPGKDLIGHLIVQHSQLLKKRRSRKGFSNNNTTTLGKDFQKLSSFLGIYPTNDGGDVPDCSPESQLSPFVSIPIHPNPEGNEQLGVIVDEKTTSSFPEPKRKGYSSVEQEHTDDEKFQRAVCIQQLVMSTIFSHDAEDEITLCRTHYDSES